MKITESFQQLYKFHSRLTWKEMLALVITITVSLCFLPISYCLQIIIENISLIESRSIVITNAIYLCLFFLWQNLGALLSRNIILSYTKSNVEHFRNRLINDLLTTRISFFSHQDFAGLNRTLILDTELIDRMANSVFSKILPAILIAITGSIILLVINWQLTMIFACLFPIMLLLLSGIRKLRSKRVTQYHEQLDKYSEQAHFMIKMYRLIRIKNSVKSIQEQFLTTTNQVKNSGVKMVMGFTLVTSIQEMIQSLLMITILLISSLKISSGAMELSQFLVFIFILFVFRRQVTVCTNEMGVFMEGMAALKKCNAVLNDPYLVTDLNKNLVKRQFEGGVRFENVSYAHTESVLLENLTFQLQLGKTNVIYGVNGSGKSTIVDLILGFINANEGTIYIDNMAIEKIDLSVFRSQVGVVFQENDLFNGSLKDNLTFGCKISDHKLSELLILLELDQWINSLPDQLDTVIGEIRSTISGGQKQRLMMIRALIGNPQLLILDEPTNHMDLVTIKKLLKVIKNLEYKPTILIISHNESVQSIADRLFHLSNGGIQEIIKSKHYDTY